jgi:hypothetical protein
MGFEIPQVFISSTSELTAERGAVADAIRRMAPPCHPFDYQVEAARRASPKDECERQIRSSNVFLLLLGASYGSGFPGEAMSIVEWEYELAKSHPTAELQTYVKTYAPGAGVKIDPRQQAFIDRVLDFGAGHWSPKARFSTPEELCAVAVEGIEAWRDRCWQKYEELAGERARWRDRTFLASTCGVALLTAGGVAGLAARGVAQGPLIVVAATGVLLTAILFLFRNLKL